MPAGVSLVAVGGYGRRELSPHSDLDLLLTFPKKLPGGFAERLWYPIWDTGVKLAHSVRSVDDSLKLSRNDLDTATSLLDARIVLGDPGVAEDLAGRAIVQWRRRGTRWLDALAAATADRHARYDDIAFAIEPDLKHGGGGLRDAQSLRWAELAGASAPRGMTDLRASVDTLTHVRNHLHLAVPRATDHLRVDLLDEVARRAGYGGRDALMAAVASAARPVGWASNELFYDIASPGKRVRFAVGSGAPDMVRTLQLATTAAAQRHRIDLQTLSELARIDPPLVWTGEQRQAFVTLLGTGRPAIPVIEALDNVGVWVKLLPEWAPARSRPQHNPYHGYTVDRHLLETVAVAATIPSDRRDLLLLAALLHDLGKAYPGDHSDVGADLAARILRRMGVVDDDVETIVIAVREHLLLPDTATRRDLDDPVTLTEVARRIGRVDRLDLLAQLALADGLATGPTAWSDWKAKLVDELVSRVRALMSGEKPASLVSIAPFPPHIEELARAAEPGEVVVEAQGNRLVVVATDRPGLFSALCGAVAVHGLDIRDARIGSLDGVAVDELVVESSFEEEIRWDRVVDDIRAAAVGDVPLDQRLADRANAYHRRPVPHTLPTAVHILDGDGDGSAIVEVVGADSLGLLYRLSRVFAALQLDITRALVTTVGGDFVDVFYIDDQGRGTLDDLDTRSTLRTHLVDAIHERF